MMPDSRRRQTGQVLIYVTLMVTLGSLILGPLLLFTYVSHRTVQLREQRMLELYAADAGIEGAMYQIKGNVDPIAALGYGNTTELVMPDDWNDRDMTVAIKKVWIPEGICEASNDSDGCRDIETPAPTTSTDYSGELPVVGLYQSVRFAAASDGFEEPDWGGGTGWVADSDWEPAGSAQKASDGYARSGEGYLQFRGSDGDASRAVNLTGYFMPRLQFYSMVKGGASASWAVSTDGVHWTSKVSLDAGSDFDIYEYNDIDLSSYGNSSNLWVRFSLDDVPVGEESYLYVDDVWVGDDFNKYTVELAYTENMGNVSLDPNVYLDSLAVWMPRGAEYIGVIDAWGLPQVEPTRKITSFADGTVVYWKYPRIDLSQSVGNGTVQLPIVRSLTFTFSGGEADQGMFAWLEAYASPSGGGDPDYISWDTGYEIYRATSSASHEIWGTNTEVEVYVGQGEIQKAGIASYGDYVATGSPLLVHQFGDFRVRETSIDGREASYATIASIPDDARVLAAWLYWSGFLEKDEWAGPDEAVEFMYPREVGFESMGEVLSNGDDESLNADYFPIVTSPEAETVWLDDGGGPVTLNQEDHYELDRDGGILTIKDDTLEGKVTMHYWVEHWEPVTHDARSRYNTDLPPAVDENRDSNDDLMGYSYASFSDVSGLVRGTGNGEFAVRGVAATPGDELVYRPPAGRTGLDWPEWCYSGWSLIVLYYSPSETAHQFYLYDPIHNPDVRLYSGQVSEGSLEIPFTLREFYPPRGVVEGRLTYFAGEGDDHFDGDSIQFKGASQDEYSYLEDDPVNPRDNVLNGKSTTGEEGVDIDTFDITDLYVGSDTEAEIMFSTQRDIWNLVYLILSFETSMVPKDDFAFNVAAMTYSYEIGTAP